MAKKTLLIELEKNVNNYARVGLNRAANRTKERLEQNVGLTDHTLKQLADLGHPYAKKTVNEVERFNRLAGTNEPTSIHNPWWLVHRQSGLLSRNIRIVHENKDEVAIGVNPSVPYLEDVIMGNSVMIGRNFPAFTLYELIDEDVIYNTMEAAIKTAVEKS